MLCPPMLRRALPLVVAASIALGPGIARATEARVEGRSPLRLQPPRLLRTIRTRRSSAVT